MENLFISLKNYLWIFFISMVPLIELRGAIPVSQALELPIVPSYIVCIIGNMIPVPIIFFFARKFLEWGADKKGIGKICTFFLVKGAKAGRKLSGEKDDATANPANPAQNSSDAGESESGAANAAIEGRASTPAASTSTASSVSAAAISSDSKKRKTGKGLFIALMLFVAIPLPGTGAWTGTLGASMLDMRFRDAVIAIILGVLIAGIIMMLGSLGVFNGFKAIISAAA